MKKFDGLSVSSKFGICGLPIRLDSYKTCSFGCKYCFSNNRKIMEFEKTLQIANIQSIANRLNKIFDKHLADRTNFLDTLIAKNLTWHCGGMSDPFQPVEKKLHVTKDILDITNQYDISILFSTKSDTVYDADISPLLHTFQLSISNIEDRKDIEPNVPSIQSRIDFFNYLKKNGFKVGIRIQPFIPNISTLDIVKSFPDADHFVLEGIKIVPQNIEHKEWILSHLNLNREEFTQMGLLNLRPEVRLEMYKPFLEYFHENNISYSIADNDLRYLSNNKCCCGDKLVKKASGFDTTAMNYDNQRYILDDVLNKVDELDCLDCKCKHLFTSNRSNGCETVREFYIERFPKKSCPFSPKFQYHHNSLF